METLMYPICLNGNEPIQNSLQGQNPIFPFGSFSANKVHVSSGSNSRKRQNELQLPRFYYADQIFLRVWSLFSVEFDFTHQNLDWKVSAALVSQNAAPPAWRVSPKVHGLDSLRTGNIGAVETCLQNSKYRASAENLMSLYSFFKPKGTFEHVVY